MTSVVELSSAAFPDFIATHTAAVIHFDAPWDSYRRQIRLKMDAAAIQYGDIVGFAEVDVDAELELALSIPIEAVPAVGYYLGGGLIAALVGADQNIEARTKLLLGGRPIGDDDETKAMWIPEPPVWPKSEPKWWHFW